jgi:hypothetical protein
MPRLLTGIELSADKKLEIVAFGGLSTQRFHHLLLIVHRITTRSSVAASVILQMLIKHQNTNPMIVMNPEASKVHSACKSNSSQGCLRVFCLTVQ